MFYNILDNVSVQMKAGFDHFGELTFLGLVDCTKFYEMSQQFDDTKLQSLSKYARYFDFVRLKADLIGLYSPHMVRNECKSPGQLLSFLAQNDVMQTVFTIPACAHYTRRCSLYQRVLTIPDGAHYTRQCSLYQLVLTIPDGAHYTSWCSLYQMVLTIPIYLNPGPSAPVPPKAVFSPLCSSLSTPTAAPPVTSRSSS